ncbi:unnamed protein product [Brassicogethes aeneus]|uniref:Gamma-aminobutyric acid type B receptor subunit 2 n=1 Tax=Brassicogethes aeneus TaxID=1431903 RepID=A0A9P0BAG1_BRAAE|nr:unnamed protein product [Brassicogethes aeneus]
MVNMIRCYLGRYTVDMLFYFLVLLFVVVQSSEEYRKCLPDKEVKPKKYAHHGDKSNSIQLDVSSRITHQLTTHVFSIFLREVVGYEEVQINHYEDNFQIDNLIERLNPIKNDIPQTWINLEAWVPPEYDSFSKNYIKDCGNLAPPGRFGWFIPNDMIAPIKSYFPEWSEDIREVHWDFFREADRMRPFDFSSKVTRDLIQMASNNKGGFSCRESFCENSTYIPKQCQYNKPCALLLSSSYNETSFVKDNIDELKLHVKVVWLGDKLRDAIDFINLTHRDRRDQSMLILSWTPSDIIEKQEDYVSVAFKHCELMKTQSGCKYELHRLVKFAWSKIQTFASDLDEALTVFRFDDYRDLLDRYEINKRTNGSKTIQDIACDWMRNDSNLWRESWSGWKNKEKTEIYIGGIFPLNGSSYSGKGIAMGAIMGIDAVNANESILPYYNLELKPMNGQCRADKVMQHFIDVIVDSSNNKKILGVLGPACSDTVEPLAGVSKNYHMLVISYSAEGATFNDREKYPYFFRTIGENHHYKHVYLKLMQHFHWKRVAALTEDGQKYTEYISSMQDVLDKENISFITNKKFPREIDSGGMSRYLQDLKSKTAKIIIADVIERVARTVMCEAYNLKMTAYDGYVWFLPMWFNLTWYNTDYFNTQNEHVNCTTAEMLKSINGYFSMSHSYFAQNDSIMLENKTVKEWREDYYHRAHQKNWEPSDYAGFAYDAVWTYALALDKLSRTDPRALSDLHSENTTIKLVEQIEKTDFNGVSGRIKFRGGPSRFSVINIYQWYDNRSNLIGNFYPNLTDDKPEILGGTLNFTKQAKWFTPDGEVPEDGTQPPDPCAVESVARFFNVQCTHAIIILNVIGTFIAAVIVIAMCWHFKKHYDKKAEEQLKRIRELEENENKLYKLTELDDWEIAREKVVINRKLGEGAFGTVYGGEADFPNLGWVPVAVKTLKTGSSAEQKLEFLSEADVMKRFQHPNIITLLGVCTQKEPVYTIMEFMLYGDLKNFLLARRHRKVETEEEVSPARLTNMALDVARGLSYLAEQRYTHRDVASRNCLLNARFNVKLADFGMTRPVCENDYYLFQRKGMLPVRWMAPECLIIGKFSPASDVWSYGVLLYEIITFGSFPFQGKSNNEVLDIVKKGGTPNIPDGVESLLRDLMSSCWQTDKKNRPTSSEIVELLATHPTLLKPCVETMVSVDLEPDQIDMSKLPDFRRGKVPAQQQNGAVRAGAQTRSASPKHQSVPMTAATLPESATDSGISILVDNCSPKEPLLGTSRSNSSLLNLGLTKYVTIQHGKGQVEEENYVNTSNGHVVTKV